ncbi:MAG: 2-oxoglutarate ferredoxin oxidoreductase subunit alpha, partial [Chitinophagaceae bacterium]|nr:2-oxoglutarate ferredoxin oxidoreductase subunit alpha [Chitinophagaceae bacterium]
IRPFPRNLGEILKSFDKVVVPEINNGQLIRIIRDLYFVDAIPYNKIKGVPITKTELVAELRKHL